MTTEAYNILQTKLIEIRTALDPMDPLHREITDTLAKARRAQAPLRKSSRRVEGNRT